MIEPRLLLDSDTLSELIKGRDPIVVENARGYVHRFEALSFTSASVLEILYGLQRKEAYAQIQRCEKVFAINDEILPDREDYRLGAEIGGALSRRGTPIGLIDPLVAACAIRRGLGVVSGNTAHYTFIQKAGYQLRLVNWRNED